MSDAIIRPAMPPPPGVTSNFVNPEHNYNRFIVVNCIFLPIAVIAVCLRSYTRIAILRNFSADDCEWYLRYIPSIVPRQSH